MLWKSGDPDNNIEGHLMGGPQFDETPKFPDWLVQYALQL